MAYAWKYFGGFKGYVRPRRVCLGLGSRTPEHFLNMFPKCSKYFPKYCHHILLNIPKVHYFSLFFKRFPNYALNFCSFGRKTQVVRNFLENAENVWWKFNRNSEFISIKLLLRIDHYEITSFFTTISSGWGGRRVWTRLPMPLGQIIPLFFQNKFMLFHFQITCTICCDLARTITY